MKIFQCYSKDLSYALEAIRAIKCEEDGNPIDLITEESMNIFLSDPQNFLIVVVIDNTVVGYIVAYELQRIDRNATMMFLYEIGVLRQY
jgi:hypothetical protein